MGISDIHWNFRAALAALFIITFTNTTLAFQNIAKEAIISTSSSLDGNEGEKVVDGIIRLDGKGEWACVGERKAWGANKLPWIQLDWNKERTINSIVLYDRPSLEEHTAGGVLKFSDGSIIRVNTIPNNGGPKKVTFPSKTIKWVKFDTTDGEGLNLGLSEIEVFVAPLDTNQPINYVNPFVESAKGRYFFFTPAAYPMGMVAAAPVTRNKNQYGGGYNYNSTEVLGFEQIHGWCVSGIQVMPTSGTIDPTAGDQAWKSGFSHDDEIAMPGYQRLYLNKHDVWTELTSTKRATIYRFKYTKKNKAQILTNLGGYLGNSTMINADVKKVSQTELEGSFDSAGRFWGGPEKVKIHFVIQFDKPFESLDGWSDKKKFKNISSLQGTGTMKRQDAFVLGPIIQSYWDAPTAGVMANYTVHPGDEIQMKIAISYTSIENARKNLQTEAKHWDFDRYKEDSFKVWKEKLGKIEVKGGTEQQRIKFYTDLWHVLLGRRILNDVSGDYPDYTQGELVNTSFTRGSLKVRTVPKDQNGNPKFNMYSFDALWLTQWNLNVIWGLAWPEILDDFSSSLVQYADNGGLLPRGAVAGGYSYIMTGNPATNMLVSTYMKGLMTKTNPKHAFEVMKSNHMPGGMMSIDVKNLEFYIANGYCPGNAGKTLEWAFQDWSLAQMAKKLKNKKDYNYFSKRTKGWNKLFHPEQKLILPKDKEGNWLHTNPLSGQGWVESNAWQGTWSVSHGIAELSTLMGGNDTLSKKLNYAFEQAASNDFVFGYSNGYVSYANQPGCSNAHVFNHVEKPWLSQYWVRRVNEQAYGAITVDQGYGGHDEDQGQMSGISALMSMGLFSLKGNNSATPKYELTSPVFDEIIIKLNPTYYEGNEFTIKTKNNSQENIYIQSSTWNGTPFNTFWFTHDAFQKGGDLILKLGPEPNKNWGVKH
ncbi:GH92 family glycosyl hydrolase [uncultured Algibacter sp.]|uniref:GH92 family glycosyl hydrolase n=1 Tax=uncultured Algibacter sp. TaxID=298659 RepID=UPI0030EDE69E|tara:strand:+ start:15831 stop:18617 length:2787 start_codon:yes stop_codon:yes gene_type:complete